MKVTVDTRKVDINFGDVRDGEVFTWGTGATWYVKRGREAFRLGSPGRCTADDLRQECLRVAGEVVIKP